MVIVNALVPVALVIIAGFWWQRANQSKNLGSIADIIVFISSPALAFSVIMRADFAWRDFALVFIGAIFVMFLSWLILSLFFKKTFKERFSEAILPIIFVNSGNLGLSLALFAFGQQGLSLAVIYHTAMLMAVYSWGIALLNKKTAILQVFYLPHLYVCTLALFLNYFNWELPVALVRGVDLLGQITIPLMLFILGSQLSRVNIKPVWKIAVVASLLRLFIGLGAAGLFVWLFQVQGIAAAIIIILSILPGAVITQTLCYKYLGQSNVAAAIVAVSTLFAIIYLPIALFFCELA